MNDNPTAEVTASRLPAQRIDKNGRAHVDQRAVLALALPLMANSAVQLVLSLTDLWFVGRISTSAVAAVGAVHWLVIAVIMVLGGVGLAVQTVVAQSFGGRRYYRASQAVWTAMWGEICVVPLFILVGVSGTFWLTPFGFAPDVKELASEFWLPRVAGASFGGALWAMLGFFNGIGRPRVTAMVMIVVAMTNVVLNQLFIFEFDWGIAGSGWATTCAQAVGFALAVFLFTRQQYRRQFRSHLTWRPHLGRLLRQWRLGLPMGLLYAADLMGFAMFQMMQVRLGTVDGAATQIVIMLTSLAYMPGFGIAQAGTTLVGQSIGAGDRKWAMRVGTRVIALAACYMGGIGVLVALTGQWLLPIFTGSHDVEAAQAVALGTKLLWLAAAYQFFDGLNLGSGMCLRGAGDAAVPAALVLALSWLVFVPLAHMFTFEAGQGWFSFLPQFGWGAFGGWAAVDIYIMLLGLMLLVRWRSGAWQKIRI